MSLLSIFVEKKTQLRAPNPNYSDTFVKKPKLFRQEQKKMKHVCQGNFRSEGAKVGGKKYPIGRRSNFILSGSSEADAQIGIAGTKYSCAVHSFEASVHPSSEMATTSTKKLRVTGNRLCY